MKIISLLILSTTLTACASKIPTPERPVLNTAQGAQCLRECETIYTTCLAPANAQGRTPIASTAGGVLISAIADSHARSNTQQSCIDMLKPCYADCSRFNQAEPKP